MTAPCDVFRIRDRKGLVLNAVKILMIAAMSVYMVGHFVPYFDGLDSHEYGANAKAIANGDFEITNPLLEEYGRQEFAGGLKVTVRDTGIPAAGVGLSLMGAAAYKAFGEWGLYYFSPVAGIALLVATERTSTRLFGAGAGLFALLLVSLHGHLLWLITRFVTDVTFSLFLVLGAFFLIRYLKSGADRHILLASACLAFSAFVRIPGVVALPAELAILAGHVALGRMWGGNAWPSPRGLASACLADPLYCMRALRARLPLRRLAVTGSFVLIPWIVFLLFWFGFNYAYFGDPLTNYLSAGSDGWSATRGTVESLSPQSPSFVENAMGFSHFLLPYPASALHLSVPGVAEGIAGSCPAPGCTAESGDAAGSFAERLVQAGGMVSIVALCAAACVAVRRRECRGAVAVLVVLTLGMVWFYATQRLDVDIYGDSAFRYMIPGYILAAMAYGYAVNAVFAGGLLQRASRRRRAVKAASLLLVVMIFAASFTYHTPANATAGDLIAGTFQILGLPTHYTPANATAGDDRRYFFDFSDPASYEEQRYPLNDNEIPPSSVLYGHIISTDEYGVIPFTPQVKYYTKEASDGSVALLKDVMLRHEVFVLKGDYPHVTAKIYADLVNNHKAVLVDHSANFCRVSFGPGVSDEACIKNLHRWE